MLFTQSTALLALAASASAHLIMQTPAPFEWEDAATKQSPLAPADFPCKQPQGTYAITTMNTWNAGDTLGVKIIGGATHGGGSCQFSITTDAKPTKDSQWKVIHSVEGNCPGGPSDNNLSENAQDTSIPEIPVTMPDNVPSGTYTFAWTWLNKIGNREFYMNCAPITVGGGNATTAEADVSSTLGKMPDMFVINLPATDCSNTAYEDFQYPEPGDSVATGTAATLGAQTTGAGCASVTALGKGAGKLGSPAQVTGAPAASSGGASEPAATSAAAPVTSAGGVFAPGASSAAASAPAATEPAATEPAAAPSAVAPSGTGVSSPGATGAPSSGTGTACDTDGAVVCIGTTQFGICDHGYAVPQALAAGTTCSNGSIARRGVRFPRAHLHRRHGSEMI